MSNPNQEVVYLPILNEYPDTPDLLKVFTDECNEACRKVMEEANEAN